MKKCALSLFLSLIMTLSLAVSPVLAADMSQMEIPADSSAAEPLPEETESSAQPEEQPAETPEEVPAEEETPAPDASQPEETAPEAPEELPAEEEVTEDAEELPEELETEQLEELLPPEEIPEMDPVEAAIEELPEAEYVSDAVYPKDKKITAATFGDYANSTGKAAGASIAYNRLVTFNVVGLKTGAANAYSNSLVMTHVMKLVQSFSSQKDYAKTMFKVVVPAGKYYLDYSMYLYSNTWLSMKGVTFYKGNLENKCMARSTPAGVSCSGYKGESNIVLEGGTWDVQQSKYSASSQTHFGTLRFGHAKNIIMANVVCNGAVNGHQVEFCGVSGITIVGCTMKNFLNTAYHNNNDYKEAIQLDIVNNADTCPSYSKYDDTVTENVVIYNNTFSNVCRGIGSHAAIYGKTYSGIVIQKNTFTNLSGAACHLLQYEKTAVVDNTMTNVGGGVELLAMCKSPDGHYYAPASGSVPAYSKVKIFNSASIISGNQITVNKSSAMTVAAGIHVGGDVHKDTAKYCKEQYGGKAFTITGVTIKNNTIKAAKDAGIWLKYAKDCTVSGNKVSGVVKGTTGNGYGIEASNCAFNTISSNTISGTAGHGIYVKDCAATGTSLDTYLRVASNKVTTTGAGNVGIYCYKSKYIRVYGSTVSSKTYAVQMNGCSYQYIGGASKRNSLKSKAKYGVYANGTSATEIKVYYDDISATSAATGVASGSKIKTKDVKFTKVKA